MDLHIWCSVENLVSLTPECIAVAWYAKEVENCRIVASSNVNLTSSPGATLPVLVDSATKEELANGAVPIIEYFKKNCKDLNASLSSKDRIASERLEIYICNKLAILSYYLLFLDRQIYDKVTSPTISSHIGFPLQYNAALQQGKRATSLCAQLGLFSSDGEDVEVTASPTLSKLHGQMKQQQSQKKQGLKDSLTTMRSWSVAKDVYDNLPIPKGKFLFGDKPGVADLLLSAHLQLQMHLFIKCSNSLQQALILHYDALKKYADESSTEFSDGLKIEEPRKDEEPLLANYFRSLIGW